MTSRTPTRGKILLASTGALLLATIVLLTSVLPAEYGWDPLGTGKRLGLVGLADSQSSPLLEESHRWRKDDIEFTLAPFEAVEYKYQMAAGAILLYQWRADAEVLYDMHAEPEGAAPGYAESFSKSRGTEAAGSYVAPFAGIHGWFWQNRGQAEVKVRLSTKGYFEEAVELRDGREFEYIFEQQRGGTAD